MTTAADAPQLMTRSAYARHRGCGRSYITKLAKAGRIAMVGDLVDVAAADAALGPQQRRVSRLEPSSASAEPRPEQPLELGPGGVPPAYAVSRAWREFYVAKEARLNCGERNGQLVQVDQVDAFLKTILSHVRQGILTLPSRVAPKVHDAKTVPQIERIILADCHEVLTELAETKINFTPTDEGLPS
jgi:hypothetical protein